MFILAHSLANDIYFYLFNNIYISVFYLSVFIYVFIYVFVSFLKLLIFL